MNRDKPKDQDLTIISKARDLVDETMNRTENFPKRVRFNLSNRMDGMAQDILEYIVMANETNPDLEKDPARRAEAKVERRKLQTLALTR